MRKQTTIPLPPNASHTMQLVRIMSSTPAQCILVSAGRTSYAKDKASGQRFPSCSGVANEITSTARVETLPR